LIHSITQLKLGGCRTINQIILKDYIPLAFAEPFGLMPTDNSCPRSFAFRCWTWRIQASECVLFAEQLQGPDLAKGYDIERHNLLAITYSFKGWR
jgi:hypothetical protein